MKTPKTTNIEYNTELLIQASKNGDLDDVKRLIPISDPKTKDSEALRLAAEIGHLDVVTLLLPVSNPNDYDKALHTATHNGHTDIVRFFIPVSDPKSYSKAFRLAANKGHIECIKLLLPVTQLEEQWRVVLQQHIDEYEVLMQKERLTKEIKSWNEHKQDNIQKRKM